MKNQYEEEIYQFFTQPDNFETMVQVAEHVDGVAQRLVQEFWGQLKIKLHEDFNRREEGDWVVDYSGAFSERYCKLWVYRKSWCRTTAYPLVSIAFEDLHYKRYPFVGIHINHDQAEYDPLAIKAAIEAMPTLTLRETDRSTHWANYQYLSFNLTSPKHLVELLPIRREKVVANLTTEVLGLAETLGLAIDEIIDKSKINP